MPRGAKIVFWICGIWFLVMAGAAFMHSPGLRLFAMLPTLAFLGATITSIVWVFIYGLPLGIRAAIPVFLCIGSGVLSAIVCPLLLDAGFGRVMHRYASIVQQVESEQIAAGSKPTRITLAAAQTGSAYAVWATRDTSHVLRLTFFVGGSFPLKHWGYLYSSSGEIQPGSFEDKQWPKKRRLRDKWFYISDQPRAGKFQPWCECLVRLCLCVLAHLR